MTDALFEIAHRARAAVPNECRADCLWPGDRFRHGDDVLEVGRIEVTDGAPVSVTVRASPHAGNTAPLRMAASTIVRLAR